MRKAAFSKLLELAKKDQNLFFAASDISEETVSEFRREVPEQLLMEGIAEGHLIGMASGLAKEGNTVFINTIAAFLTRRGLDQIYVNLCLDRANVKLLAQGGGLVYGRHGPTHHANEDIALMRTLPGMTILVPCDIEQTKQAVEWAAENSGPVYIRLSKGTGEIISSGRSFDLKSPLLFGNPQRILFVTMGTMTQVALEVSQRFPQSGVMSLSFIKPFPTQALMEVVENVDWVVVLEEHVESGGLTSCVCEALVQWGSKRPRFASFNLRDAFVSDYGRQEELWEKHGLGAETIYQKMKDRLHGR